MPHWFHFHWHFAVTHAGFSWADVCCYGGGAAMIWAGLEMLGGTSLLVLTILAATAVEAGTIDFSGLAGTIVALTGFTGVLTGFVLNLRKIRVEEMRLEIEDNKGKITSLEEQIKVANEKAVAANARADATDEQLKKTRENFHRTTNIVAEMDLERQAKKLTPDPDRSGPQKVIVVNDKEHPVPTAPEEAPGA